MTSVSIGSTLIAMIIILYSITRGILLSSYENLEDENIRQDAKRVMSALDDEIEIMKSIVGDWAPWNDTYQYIMDHNNAYVENNLNELTLGNLNINFILFVNLSNKVVFGKAVDLETGKLITLPQSILNFIHKHPILLHHTEKKSKIAGLVNLSEGPAIIASAPIVTSRFEGPARGTLVVGKYFNTVELEKLSQKIQLPIKLLGKKDENSLLLSNSKDTALTGINHVEVKRESSDILSAQIQVNDIYEKPIMKLRLEKKRSIYNQGRTSLKYFLFSLVLIGFVFILAILIFLKKEILSRIKKLKIDVKKISADFKHFQKVTVRGKDELSDLASDINYMLDVLRESSERDSAILENIEDGYFEVDLEGNFLIVNNSFSRLMGYGINELLSLNIRNLTDEFTMAKMIRQFNALYNEGKMLTSVEEPLIRKDGKKRYIQTTVSVIRNTEGEEIGFRCISRDVTRRRETEEQLVYMAFHDPLTGLYNRKVFYDQLEKELNYAKRYNHERAILYIDLDRFKQVNDSYGHNIGDLLLKEVAQRLERALRRTDFNFRVGGDEFTVILTNPKSPMPEIVSERIFKSISKSYQFDQINIDFITPSIGIATYPENGKDADALIRYADNAMYEKKKNHS